MTWARVCDGPGCDTWQRGHQPPGWLDITHTDSLLHFCGWECVIRYGARFEPPTILEAP